MGSAQTHGANLHVEVGRCRGSWLGVVSLEDVSAAAFLQRAWHDA